MTKRHMTTKNINDEVKDQRQTEKHFDSLPKLPEEKNKRNKNGWFNKKNLLIIIYVICTSFLALNADIIKSSAKEFVCSPKEEGNFSIRDASF
mmetsp:Transcript_7917/g.6996  ORF Transcript_7917/g.6996 Transcript_7917/m.6996 type:complete len:93 (-) Transcript_7917:460-738(-)